MPDPDSTDLARPLLRWRRTWPDGEPEDFTAGDPDHPMMHARIYRSRTAGQVGGQWSWAVGERANLGTGTAETARAAALAAEAAWFAHRATVSALGDDNYGETAGGSGVTNSQPIR